MATSRPKRVSRARYDFPHATFADRGEDLVRAKLRSRHKVRDSLTLQQARSYLHHWPLHDTLGVILGQQ